MEKLRRSFEVFTRALKKFEETLTNPLFAETFSLEFQIEILTKRFEYTYEAMWKAVKEFLKSRGLECYSPRSCFEALFREGLLEEIYLEPLFEMILIRNSLVPVYDEEIAQKYFEELKKPTYLQCIKEVYEIIQANLEK